MKLGIGELQALHSAVHRTGAGQSMESLEDVLSERFLSCSARISSAVFWYCLVSLQKLNFLLTHCC